MVVSNDFWDSSALAKRYVPERGSIWVARRTLANGVAITRLTIIEMASTLQRRFAEGSLSQRQRDALYSRFLSDARGFEIIEATPDVLRSASTLILEQPSSRAALRSLDAIQLAGAALWFERMNAHNMTLGVFVVADRRLWEAAMAAGLPVLNPEDYG